MSSQSPKYTPPRLSGAFSSLIRDKGWEKKFEQHRIFPAWKELVDRDTALYARPLKIVKDVLWVEVDNSAWMQQLQYQKLFLLENLNNYLKHSKLKDIRFVVQEKPHRESEQKQTRIRFVPPPVDQVEAFKDQVGIIEDEKIREALTRLWYLSQACKKE